MVVLLDTNVLVAAFVASHPHHHSAIRWFQQAEQKKITLILSAHSLAESYAVLTRLPVSPKISPTMSYRILKKAIPSFRKIVSLDPEDYLQIVSDLSLLELSGGVIYDAIILKTAQKYGADKLVTFNMKHFIQLCDDPKFIISALNLSS